MVDVADGLFVLPSVQHSLLNILHPTQNAQQEYEDQIKALKEKVDETDGSVSL